VFGQVLGGEVVAFVNVGAVDLEVHDVRPIFEGDDAEEGKKSVEDGSEVDGIILCEEHHSGDGVDIKKEEEEEGDVEHRWRSLKRRSTGPKPPEAGMRQTATMRKSNTFQGSLKKSNGRGESAMIFRMISKMKMRRTRASSEERRV